MTGDRWVLPPELRELAEGGESGVVEEVLAVFVSDTAERIAAMRVSCAALQREELRKQGHALKGSSGQVGAAALSALCNALESTAIAGPQAEIAALIDRLEVEFQDVARAMTRTE